LLLSNTTFPLSTEPTNILHQNILFQRIHHLLLQYEKFIRDLRHVIWLCSYSFIILLSWPSILIFLSR
jgi:hypothetical protein